MKTWTDVPLFDMPAVEVVVPQHMTDQARALFGLWCETYHGGKTMTYSEQRERRLIKGLKEFGYEACREAILGMQYSEWHMGRNREGRKYIEYRVALRNEDSILHFAELYRENVGGDAW